MPSTITGCASVAEKPSPTRLWSEESGSLMRTVKIVPGFMVNGGDTIGASCPNTTLAMNSEVTMNVLLRRTKIVVRSIAPSDQPEILIQETCKAFISQRWTVKIDLLQCTVRSLLLSGQRNHA